MIILLSPAKTIDLEPASTKLSTDPQFLKDMEILLAEVQKLTPKQLKSLFDVSDDLTKLNADRYKNWDEQPTKQAALAFDGPAYRGLQASALSDEDLEFAQDHLRILSGLYGILRPLDLIKPYRLEMGKKLANPRGKDLYSFWGSTVTEEFNKELSTRQPAQQFIVNCASQEYFKVVQLKLLDYPVYTMSFPGPAIYAKQARGAMVRYILTQRILEPQGLQGFTGVDGEWKFDQNSSSELNFVFRRIASASSKRGGVDEDGEAKPAKSRKKKK